MKEMFLAFFVGGGGGGDDYFVSFFFSDLQNFQFS